MSHHCNESIVFNGTNIESQKRELLDFLEQKDWNGVQVLIGGDFHSPPGLTGQGWFFFKDLDVDGAQTICISFLKKNKEEKETSLK